MYTYAKIGYGLGTHSPSPTPRAEAVTLALKFVGRSWPDPVSDTLNTHALLPASALPRGLYSLRAHCHGCGHACLRCVYAVFTHFSTAYPKKNFQQALFCAVMFANNIDKKFFLGRCGYTHEGPISGICIQFLKSFANCYQFDVAMVLTFLSKMYIMRLFSSFYFLFDVIARDVMIMIMNLVWNTSKMLRNMKPKQKKGDLHKQGNDPISCISFHKSCLFSWCDFCRKRMQNV